jgi:hypothetical protein
MRRSKERPDPLSDFASAFPAARAALEESVHDLLSGGWEEPRRKRAQEIASALAQGARKAGWKDTAAVLGAIVELVDLPLGEVLTVRDELRNKLMELLELLGDDPLAQTG